MMDQYGIIIMGMNRDKVILLNKYRNVNYRVYQY